MNDDRQNNFNQHVNRAFFREVCREAFDCKSLSKLWIPLSKTFAKRLCIEVA